MQENKRIEKIKTHSLAGLSGIVAGEYLLLVNGQEFSDLIDLSFLFADESLELTILSADKSRERIVLLEKELDEEVGLEFSTAVFDGVKRCANNCLFCFVDQMAPNMRESLYVKDDDYRLSFLYGNFITLTNMTEQDEKRITSLNLSPLYISVQATDEQVRKKLLGNRNAGQLLCRMQHMAAKGIKFHTQVVLCSEINDGAVLEKTYLDLLAMHDSVLSVAVVPVGMTKYRQELEDLPGFDKEQAQKVVKQIAFWQEECRKNLGRSFIYPADEFYVLAGMDFPPARHYDGFPQYENGIGIARKFIDEWVEENVLAVSKAIDTCVVCGKSAESILQPLINELNKVVNSKHYLLAVENIFFGDSVTVTGLLTGQDIINAVLVLPDKPERLIIPGVALRKDEDLFLDGFTGQQVKKVIDCPVKVAYSAAELKGLLLGKGW